MVTDYRITHIPTGISETFRIPGQISHLFVTVNPETSTKYVAFQFHTGQYVDTMTCRHVPYTDDLNNYKVEELMCTTEEKHCDCGPCADGGKGCDDCTCAQEPTKESECTGKCDCRQQERPECLYEHIPGSTPSWGAYIIPALIGLGILWLVTSF